MDAAEEIGRTASRYDSVSGLTHDQGAADDAERSAWQIMEEAYMAASGNGTLPLARQIFYQARPKIMAMTDDMNQYGYFSQTLLRLH